MPTRVETIFTAQEHISKEKLKQLLSIFKDQDARGIREHLENGDTYTTLQKLTNIYNRFIKKGDISIPYRIANCRLYPKNFNCCTILKREHRDYLYSDNYFELDIKNCLVSILTDIVKSNPGVFKEKDIALMNKIYDRDTLFTGYEHLDKSKIKMELIMCFTNSRTNTNCEFLQPRERQRLRDIREKMVHMPEYSKLVKKYTEKDNMPIGEINYGSTIASIAFTGEKTIMLTLIDVLEESGINIGPVNYDGIYLNKTDRQTIEENLVCITERVNEESGLSGINFAIKDVIEPNSESISEHIDIDEVEIEEEDVHELVFRELEKWSKQNGYIRVGSTVHVLYLKDEGILYTSKLVYKTFEDMFRKFQTHLHKIGKKSLIAGEKGYSFPTKRKVLSDSYASRMSEEFAFRETDIDYLGYKDGVLYIPQNKFIKKEDFIYDNILARNYFDINYSVVQPEPGSDLVRIFTGQDWTEETVDCLYILLGRLWSPISGESSKDDWGLVINFWGASSTGKSTMLNAHADCIQTCNKAVLGADGGDSFALQGKNNLELLACHEALNIFTGKGNGKPPLDPEVFKSMTRGEEVEINGKNQAKYSEHWTTPMLLCSQGDIKVQDSSGAIKIKRMVAFKFSNQVDQDPYLAERVKRDYKKYVGFFIDKYHKMCDTNTDFTKSEQIVEWADENQKESDDFLCYLSQDMRYAWDTVVYEEGASLSVRAVDHSFKKYCDDNGKKSTIKLSPDNESMLVKRLNVKGQPPIVKTTRHECGECYQVKKDCKCKEHKRTTHKVWNNVRLMDGKKKKEHYNGYSCAPIIPEI